MTAPPLRLIVTGSRNFTSKDFVWRQLDNALRNAGTRGLVVVQGECPWGPDRFAAQWALDKSLHGSPVDFDPYPADWSKGPAGGFRRNEAMVKAGAWGCLGFLADCIKPGCRRPRPHGSHGTSHCLKVAKRYGIPIKAWKTKGWQT